jgi:hypothetical protein
MYEGKPYHVIKADLPAADVAKLIHKTCLDSIGPAVYGALEQLTRATITIIK